MKQELVQLLVEMFRSYGYKTEEGAFCDIVGKRQDYEIWVKCDMDGNLDTLERFTQQSNGKNSLYITTKRIKGGDETVQRYAQDTGVVIWDRDELAKKVGAFMVTNLSRETLEMIVGSYCIESMVDQKKNFDPISAFAHSKNPNSPVKPEFEDSETDIFSPAEKKYVSADVSGFPSSFLAGIEEEKEREEIKVSKQETRPETKPEASEYIIAEPKKPETKPKETVPVDDKFKTLRTEIIAVRASRLNMPIERAVAIGKSTFGEVKDVILKFVPYWKYSYTLAVDRKMGTEHIKMAASGDGIYNAVTGFEDSIELGEISEQTEIPDIDYVLKQAKVTKEEIRAKILEKLILENTKQVKTNNTDAQSVIYQNKTFKPLEKDFDIKITQVFASVWEVKGKKDCIEINAYNSQQLTNPADDGAEFV
ncbi:hypothetical protein [Methanolapillus ohkumae]|uniref:Uncharacterized protein n=1 Tax=Methanolapillus ohkumae TaxID=3028298 RepID=A0AA96VHF0_9EURY|nr:hypothetical protein MsAm2_03540 [Methanosarcinaceae archaeon Am2]